MDIVRSLAGGVLIGLASALLLWANGRIAGITGIARHALEPGERSWRLLFLLGLIAGAVLVYLLTGHAPVVAQVRSPLLLIGAGLLVGLGTVCANGCTSGHGVCGLGRLSVRSLVAVCVFLSVAVLTATLTGGGA
ncbi:YeeE/YedE family protein [Burkholderiaceae bacterium DAT-1]|nr:YeeE/YedE family protein [Burkholderiaceae bacterium DAT-1]